jgi:hypothetical protein
MRRVPFPLLLISAWTLSVVSPATAKSYAVCLAGGSASCALHCGFVTFEQCRATASGIGGSCIVNPATEAAVYRGTLRR